MTPMEGGASTASYSQGMILFSRLLCSQASTGPWFARHHAALPVGQDMAPGHGRAAHVADDIFPSLLGKAAVAVVHYEAHRRQRQRREAPGRRRAVRLRLGRNLHAGQLSGQLAVVLEPNPGRRLQQEAFLGADVLLIHQVHAAPDTQHVGLGAGLEAVLDLFPQLLAVVAGVTVEDHQVKAHAHASQVAVDGQQRPHVDGLLPVNFQAHDGFPAGDAHGPQPRGPQAVLEHGGPLLLGHGRAAPAPQGTGG